MSDLEDKTPVSRLQEYMVANKMVPQYDVFGSGMKDNRPIFTCRVKAGDFSEEGIGRSKREAKHRAAERMLKNFNIIEPTEEDELSESSMCSELENSVGQLKEFCLNKCYPEPKFFLEESSGPPHRKTFRMTCCVSQLQDHGVSSTKKQAKQEAAKKMLNRLMELKSQTPDIFPEPAFEEHKLESKETLSKMDADIAEKFQKLKPFSAVTSNKDPRVFYKDHHKAYVGLQETSSTLLRILNNVSEVNSDNSVNLMNTIAQELEVTVTKSEVPTGGDQTNVIVAMSVYPPVAGLGDTERNAALNLLKSLLFLCRETWTLTLE